MQVIGGPLNAEVPKTANHNAPFTKEFALATRKNRLENNIMW